MNLFVDYILFPDMSEATYKYIYKDFVIDFGDEILNQSVEIFKKHGILEIDLDDIARETGISKHDITEHYENKKAIIDALSDKFFEIHNDWYRTLKREGSIDDEFTEIMRYCSDVFNIFSPDIINEVRQCCPDILDKYIDHKENVVLPKISKNIKDGVKSGVYSKKINATINSKIYVEQLQQAFDTIIFPNSNHDRLEIVKIIIRNQLYGLRKNGY